MEKTVLSGDLCFMSLADLFQVLGGNQSTGTLNLTSPHSPHMGRIHFLKGNPINAGFGTLNGLKALYSMFGFIEGKYHFYKEDVEHINRTIRSNRMEIILDALKMLDDGEIERIGSPSESLPEMDRETGSDKGDFLPVIKGPLPDYLYVIRDEFIKDGTDIVQEGAHGKWIWMIYEGTVKVNRKTSKGSLTIARLGPGCFIGTIRALIFGDYERNSTVTAEGDVRLCLLDSEPFYREYANRSPNFRKLLLSLDSRLRSINGKLIDLYEGRSPAKFLSENRKINAPKGAQPGDLYLIKEGKADIIGQSRKGDLLLSPLNRDDFFGNIPFVDLGHEPSRAYVAASDNLEVEKLDSQIIEDEYNSISHTFRNMIFNLGTYISSTTRLVYEFHMRR